MIIFFKDREELFRKLFREEHRTIHDPGVRAADLNAGEQSLFARLKTPFGSLAFHKYGRVPSAAFISVVHIIPHPVVGREKICVSSDKTFAGAVECCQSVLIVVFRVIEKLDTEFVDQILELFL